MFNKLFELLLGFVHLFRFWVVLYDNMEGVVMRVGKRHKRIGPGVSFILPFNIDTVWADEITPYTEKLDPQSLTTYGDENEDAQEVTISAVVTWVLTDVYRYNFKVSEGSDAILDLIAGSISAVVQSNYAIDVLSGEVLQHVVETANLRAHQYGLKVLDVQFADASKCGVYRIIGQIPATE